MWASVHHLGGAGSAHEGHARIFPNEGDAVTDMLIGGGLTLLGMLVGAVIHQMGVEIGQGDKHEQK